MTNGFNKPFEFGLVMAGAVSAGAYTAGVIDFLLEALEAWEQAKAGAEAVPNHSVLLKAMSGASAGAMVTAITARALATTVTPVVDVDHPPDTPAGNPADERNAFRNPFYAAWVQSIDIHHLLGTRDLKGDAPVMSILDSTALPEIGGNVLRATGVLRPARPAYVAETVDLYFTTTNLRGVPYGFGLSGQITDYHHMMTAYADNVHFALRWGNAVPPSKVGGPAVTLDPTQLAPSGSWDAMMNSALASGAFPVGLAPRLLSRPAADYDSRTWELPDDHPLQTVPVGNEEPIPVEVDLSEQRRIINDPTEPRMLRAVVRSEDALHPFWPDGIRGTAQRDPLLPPDADPAYRYEYWNVDGGVMNNEPLELVRRALAGGDRNPRDGRIATRAVVMIDPFPNTSDVAAKYDRGISLVTVIKRLFGALVDQARFKPDDLKLAEAPDVYSRFVVAPIYQQDGGGAVEPAIASATLGAFGGFLAEPFRRHDFQLGRRNCQRFLQKHFVLPLDNPLFAAWRDDAKFARFVFAEANERGEMEKLAPIIPLVGKLATQIPLPARPRAANVDLDDLRKLVRGRVNAVVPGLIDEVPTTGLKLLLKALWAGAWVIGQRGKIVDLIMDKIGKEIAVLG